MYAGVMATQETFGALVRRYRKSRQWTVQELADRVSSDKSTISRIENDKTGMPTDTLYYGLIDTLGIDELEALQARRLYRGAVHPAPRGDLAAAIDRIASLPSGARMRALIDLAQTNPRQYQLIETLFRDWLQSLIETQGTTNPSSAETPTGRPGTVSNGQTQLDW